ncbi:MAG: hypothetical protein R2911_00990 [Caldilineaceae bacterium]
MWPAGWRRSHQRRAGAKLERAHLADDDASRCRRRLTLTGAHDL